MSFTLQSASSIAAGVRVILVNASDTYVEVAGVTVATTDGADAIFSSTASTNDVLQIGGQVIGGNGINFNSSTSRISLTNNNGGYISGASGFAIQALGQSTITNYGEISGTGGGANLGTGAFYNYGTLSTANGFSGPAISYGGPGIVYNFGTINSVVGVSFKQASATNFLYNSGTIRTTTGIVDDSQNALNTDTFINTGSIVSDGYAFQGNGTAPIQFTNAGTITGSVSAGKGTFDSTLGQVFGVIYAASAGSTIVGGTNGGNIFGFSGNDILYANPTRAAADAASTTTLSGGTGTNALYGDGAFTTFLLGTSNGGYNQVWGGASEMAAVTGYTNNTLSFANASNGVYVDLLAGHNAYVSSGTNWTGTGVFEDSIENVPNVIGSAQGDLIQADNGTDRITGGGSADSLYAGSGAASQDSFVYTAYGDSNVVTGYDTIVGFKIGTDKIDLSALHTDASHLAISTAGTSNTLYVETTPGTFNANTDLAMIVNTSAAGGLKASDFVF